MIQRHRSRWVRRHSAAVAMLLCGPGLTAACAGKDGADVQGTDASSSASVTSEGTSPTTGDPASTSPATTTSGGESTAGVGSSTSGSAEDTGSETGLETTGGELPDGILPGISDEFDDASTLSEWTRRHEVDGEPAGYTTLDIDESASGRLTFVPTAGGWFGDFVGPLLYKEITGDFMVEVSVRAGNVNDPAVPPTQSYNSAGVMVRDPGSEPGNQDWVVHNVGFQSGVVATEGKTTFDSMSSLEIVEGAHEGRLRICRLGTQVILTRRLEGEDAFTETHRYTRTFPETLQVGLALNGWNSLGQMPNLNEMPDLHAEFDYIRFFELTEAKTCLEDAGG